MQRIGGLDREIRVELDPARLLQALGLTAVEVNEQLRQLNLDAPGGRAQVGGGEQAIRVLGGAKSAEQLGDTHHITPGGKSVRCAKSPTYLTASRKPAQPRALERTARHRAFGLYKSRASPTSPRPRASR